MLGYGIELWGWKEREGMERLEEKYIKWVLGVERETPGYMVREEIQREKLRGRAGNRAWGFEKRLERGEGSELARMRWEEIRMRAKERRGKTEWEKERSFFEDRDVRAEDISKLEEERKEWYEN